MVRRATIADLDALAPLFDAYRQFYRKPADPDGSRQFLRDRIELNESVVFLAFEDDGATGFAQLYPIFSSAALARTFILNDLFVSPDARRRGTGTALLNAAVDYGRSVGAYRLTLSTQLTNTVAQAVYESNGWARDSEFCVYHRLI